MLTHPYRCRRIRRTNKSHIFSRLFIVQIVIESQTICRLSFERLLSVDMWRVVARSMLIVNRILWKQRRTEREY